MGWLSQIWRSLLSKQMRVYLGDLVHHPKLAVSFPEFFALFDVLLDLRESFLAAGALSTLTRRRVQPPAWIAL
jgi:hypothetical protein